MPSKSQNNSIREAVYLRDQFAMHALNGLINWQLKAGIDEMRRDGGGVPVMPMSETHPDDPLRIAISAYEIADEMMRVRGMTPDQRIGESHPNREDAP